MQSGIDFILIKQSQVAVAGPTRLPACRAAAANGFTFSAIAPVGMFASVMLNGLPLLAELVVSATLTSTNRADSVANCAVQHDASHVDAQ